MGDREELSATIKDLALAGGFDRVGIAAADEIEMPGPLRHWLERDYHAGMAYMAENVAKRLRPSLIVEGARSVICLAVSYAPPQSPDESEGREPHSARALVARYARGRDYHRLLKRRCHALMDRIRLIRPDLAGRAFVDTAPLAERSLAAAAGVGWIGRNGCLIAGDWGSYVLLCEIVCNLDLPPDPPMAGGCGDCHACLDACPTRALQPDGLVDASRCVSYLTIEHRGRIDPQLWPMMGSGVFGCDACQAACPHNANVRAGQAELTALPAPLAGADLADILSWDHNRWDRATRGSATRRATLDMFLRNAVIAAGNAAAGSDGATAGRPEALRQALRDLRGRREDLAEMIDWALVRLS